MNLLSILQERRSTVNPAIDTPATAGKWNHETLFGSQARSAWHWRLAFFGVLAVVLWDRWQMHSLIAAKVYAPVVIGETVDGATRYIGTPDPTWKPQDRNIVTALKELVEVTRGRTTDAKFDRKRWQRMVDRSTEHGRIQLAQAYQEMQKIEEKGRIEVDILTVNKGSDDTFDVRWEERRHDVNNAMVGKPLRFLGKFTVVIEVPVDLVGLSRNENGVWFEGWNLSREER